MKLELDDFPPEVVDALTERVAARVQQIADASRWMTVEQAAAHLRWPVSRLQKESSPKVRDRLPERERVPLIRHRGRVWYDRDDLDAWFATFRDGPDLRDGSKGR
jgi:hypothetical protein